MFAVVKLVIIPGYPAWKNLRVWAEIDWEAMIGTWSMLADTRFSLHTNRSTDKTLIQQRQGAEVQIWSSRAQS